MDEPNDFREAQEKLLGSCRDLIYRGIDDPVAYELFVRIHLHPWLLQVRQVAERLAELEVVAQVAGSTDTNAVLEHLRASAAQQLAQAIDHRDASMATRAAVFFGGVGLAIEACEASVCE